MQEREGDMTTRNMQWRLVRRPCGEFSADDLALESAPMPQPGPGQVLVRNIYLMMPPSARLWMNEEASYLPPLELGSVMRGLTLGVVEQSMSPEFVAGDFVNGFCGWQQYCVALPAELQKVEPRAGIPLAAYRSAVGVQGVTAYCGLAEVLRPEPGRTLVVTAAAGSVGSLACQIAKLMDLRVIGIAGSDEKCDWLTRACGIDGAINYRRDDLDRQLDALCPRGIDLVFENVGGPTMDRLLRHINRHARIALCGMVADYNTAQPYGLRNLMQLVIKSARVEGFLVSDYYPQFAKITRQLEDWTLAGKLAFQLDIIDGVEQACRAQHRLFDGANQGAQFVRVTPDPTPEVPGAFLAGSSVAANQNKQTRL